MLDARAHYAFQTVDDLIQAGPRAVRPHALVGAISSLGRLRADQRLLRGVRTVAVHLVFGAVQQLGHHGYLFANARGTRVKLLMHDGFGLWCASRRLNTGRFVWPVAGTVTPSWTLTQAQFDALMLGLPWQRLHELSAITRA